jgi:threonine dehydratase
MPNNLPLTRPSVKKAHEVIKPHVYRTPVQTNKTLSTLASTPQSKGALKGTPWEGREPVKPKIKLFFKCENFQRVGAFKVRGAFHAVACLTDGQRSRGVVTHSSGNHAQALALAARTFGIPAHIVMPEISTPTKIAGTRGYGADVVFSGSTSEEREAKVAEVIRDTGSTLIPPYDHPDIILGQGTMALELEKQVKELTTENPNLAVNHHNMNLDAVITPCGGGGMLSGVATAFFETPVKVFGAEPSFEGADDAKRGVEAGKRIDRVKSLTIADGLRTPLSDLTFSIISDKRKVEGLYSVTEQNIKDAWRLVLERMKCVVEPSAVVGLATILYNEDFRRLVEKEAGDEGWNIGVVFSGGNTSVEAIGKLFAQTPESQDPTHGRDNELAPEQVT